MLDHAARIDGLIDELVSIALPRADSAWRASTADKLRAVLIAQFNAQTEHWHARRMARHNQKRRIDV